MSLLDRALDAAARTAWEAEAQRLTPWDDLAESTRDVMRNLVRLPVIATLAVAADLCAACRDGVTAPTPEGECTCLDAGTTGP